MLQPSSSGVMHAYVKERAREGMGTAVPARARLRPRNARTGTHGTGCACRCLRELLALRRSAASTRPALESSTAVFRRLPCLQTRYIVESAADAPLRTQIDPAQPLASVGGGGRIPDPCLALFHLYGICKPFLIAGLGGPAHEKGPGRIPDPSEQFKCLLDPASCAVACCTEPTPPLPVRASSPRQRGREPRAGTRGPFPKPGFLPKPTLAMNSPTQW